MKVTLISHTPQPEKIVAAAAKICYSDSSAAQLMDGLDDEKSQKFVEMLSSLGHESPIEHVTFTFGIEGVSRTFLAQITRHRLASYSVQSQRYVKQDNFVFITPPEIENNEECKKLFNDSMKSSLDAYNKLADLLEQKHYDEFISSGIDEKTARSRAEKKAIEDARFVLPNACETKMVVTMNARSLLNFFRMRCCLRAQWEIKAAADDMLKLCVAVAPSLFKKAGPSCVMSGRCTEGKMTCGKAAEITAHYAEVKRNIANA
ncbi:MAG: FAD-dependent thymidylate synthase [Oscillospiraceae bacterium]|nr:FAD-dependent thymidylate synthase [Oscillospiraceae bacterium]